MKFKCLPRVSRATSTIWCSALDLWIETLLACELWAELGWINNWEANKSSGEMVKLEQLFWLELSGRWSALGEISTLNFYKYFQKHEYKERIWENISTSLLTFLALCSRMDLVFWALLCLANLLLLSLFTAKFPKVKFLEALGDLSIVDSIILETLCFNVMYQLTWMLLPFSYLDDFKILLWIRPVMHVGVTARCGYATGLRN